MGRRVDPRQLDIFAVADAVATIATFKPIEIAPSTVRLTPLIDAVQICVGGRRRYGRVSGAAGEEVERRLAEWHGFGSTRLNLEPTFETVSVYDVPPCDASAHVVRGGRGLFLAGFDLRSPERSTDKPPLAWDWTAYTTRDAAIQGVAALAIAYFERIDRTVQLEVTKAVRSFLDGDPVQAIEEMV